MVDYLKRTWRVVDLDAIEHNFQVIRDSLPEDCKMMAVVKADAYGHGDIAVARTCGKLGVDWFAVSNIEEAISLRRQGIGHPILVLGFTPPELVCELSHYHITQALISLDYACSLQEFACQFAVTVDVHIKADTGMSRLGFAASHGEFTQALEELKEVAAMSQLHIGGIFTHFPCSDEGSPESIAFVEEQIVSFRAFCAAIEKMGIPLPLKHCCNSAGILNYRHAAMDMVRPGCIRYGFGQGDDLGNRMDLWPAMELYTTVAMVKTVPAGTQVGYGRTFTAPKEMKIASCTIGYADGYSRHLSNKGYMLIHGKKAPIVGRVCMDQLMLDVTDIPQVKQGDVVTVFGPSDGAYLSAEEVSAMAGTIPNDFLSEISKRVPRIYKKNGSEFAVNDIVRRLYEEK